METISVLEERQHDFEEIIGPISQSIPETYEQATPPVWFHCPIQRPKGYRASRVKKLARWFKPAIPRYIWYKILDAGPLFGLNNLWIYAPDAKDFVFPPPHPRDPQLFGYWQGRWWRIAIWDIEQDLTIINNKEESHARRNN